MVGGVAVGVLEVHVRLARATGEEEDRLLRGVGPGSHSSHRKGEESPRVDVGALRHDQRAAVGRDAAAFPVVLAGLQGQLPSSRAAGHHDRVRLPGQTQVGRTRQQPCDEHEGEDPRPRQDARRLHTLVVLPGQTFRRHGVIAWASGPQSRGQPPHGVARPSGPKVPGGQKPRRCSCLGSRCQSLATLTWRSRNTFWPSRASMPRRALVPTSRRREPPRPMMIAFCDGRST